MPQPCSPIVVSGTKKKKSPSGTFNTTDHYVAQTDSQLLTLDIWCKKITHFILCNFHLLTSFANPILAQGSWPLNIFCYTSTIFVTQLLSKPTFQASYIALLFQSSCTSPHYSSISKLHHHSSGFEKMFCVLMSNANVIHSTLYIQVLYRNIYKRNKPQKYQVHAS